MAATNAPKVDAAEVRRLVYGSETFVAQVSMLQDYVESAERRELAGEVISGDELLLLHASKAVLAQVERGRPKDLPLSPE